ncbi:cytochrome P450 [Tanacetum coccineum]
MEPMSPDLPWTTVSRKRRQHNQENLNSHHHPHPNNSITYYFTNFPTNWDYKVMKDIFAKYGNVEDVFIASKRNLQGKRFGFSRFTGVTNPTAFEHQLNTICIGTQRIRCNIAKFQRRTTRNPEAHRNTKHQPHTTRVPVSRDGPISTGTSYTGMLNKNHSKPIETIKHIIDIPLPYKCNKTSIFAELKTTIGATNTHNLILDEGFEDFTIKYLGGLTLLINLPDQNAANKVLSNPTLLTHFKSLLPWSNEFRIMNRVTWLAISGLPPQNFGRWNPFLPIGKQLIHKNSYVPFGSGLIPIRVTETEGEIDSLFNGYVVDSSSEDGDDETVQDDDNGKEWWDDQKGDEVDQHEEESVAGTNFKKVMKVMKWIIMVRRDHKRSWIKRLCCEQMINFVGIQETMIGNLARLDIQSMWNNSQFDFSVKKPDGKSRGIVAIWDISYFTLSNTLSGDGFLALIGRWRNVNIPCIFVVVYAPQEQRLKKELWLNLSRLILNNNTLTIVLGDFNEVRSQTERLGTVFDPRGASNFNEFISTTGLHHLPMGAKRFTRMNNLGNKLSKIDRILVSQHAIDKWPNSNIIALPREFSDHTPILLSSSTADFGPIPFKLFNSWLLNPDFFTIVQTCWVNMSIDQIHPGVYFKLKLQRLKADLKQWLAKLDIKAESQPLSSDEVSSRISLVRSLATIEHVRLKDLKQKAKIHWAMDGDENSRFFHGMINNRNHSRPTYSSSLFNQLSVDEVQLLDTSFSDVEIKDAVGIIIDGPLIVDEIIAWAKKRKKRCMFLKVDFEKAFDTLSWSFLLSIMEQMGFSVKWRTLNVTLLESTNNNIFHGIKVGKEKVHISHLQFEDNALIMGEWSLSNAKNLSRILTCFHLAFGLRVTTIRSQALVGLPIGAKMTSCSNWNPLERFLKRLSNWKAKTLSFGGQLTLIRSVLDSLGVYYFSTFKAPKKIIYKLEGIRRRFFWGGSANEKKISWIAWDKVTSPRNMGGLGIGRLKASNQSLLAKWWWRIRNEEHALWSKVICSLHGPMGGLVEDSGSVIATIQTMSILAEQFLDLMHRFSNRIMKRTPEINRVKSLSDHPLIDYGQYTLKRMTGANMRNCVHLKGARDELL